jgi:hypothetical protein
VAYWVKLNYDRKEYFVDLDRISAFALAPNGRLTFWLPDSSIPLIFTRQANADEYYKVLDYINRITTHSLTGTWARIEYDRKEYFVDLNRISSFCHAGNKLIFWLPDCAIDIVLTEQGDPDIYKKVREFIMRKTGESIP